MIKYSNYKNYLQENSFTVSTTVEEFIEKEEISFVCQHDHVNTMKASTFGNKKSKVKIPSELCSQCCKSDKLVDQLKLVQDEISSLNGHKVISFLNNKNVTYICGNCGSENHTTLVNLKRNTGICSACQGSSSRNSYEKVSEIISQKGFEILWSRREFETGYINKDVPIPVKCPCGEQTKMRIQDIKMGKRCMKCRSERLEATSMIKYGTPNPSQSQEVKDKIVQTNIERLGVAYPQQNPDVLAKTKETCRRLFGKEFAFNQEWVYEKIEKIFMERYGVRKPFSSPVYMEKFKKIMLEKYGSEFTMQVPEFFHKAVATGFSSKSYHFPSGRVDKVMGYEPYVLDYLLKTTPEDEIITGDQVPCFDYHDENDKKRKYYPDIYVTSSSLIIEVKSTWTFNMCPLTNLAKLREVARQGFNAMLFIVHKKRVWDKITYTEDRVSSRNHPRWDGKSPYPMEPGQEPTDEDTEMIVDEIVQEEIEEVVLSSEIPCVGSSSS